MIDLVLYRFRVGVYHGNSLSRKLRRSKTGKTGSIFNQDSFNHDFFILDFFNTFKRYPVSGLSSSIILLYMFCILYMIYVVATSLLMASASPLSRPSFSYNCLGGGPSVALSYTLTFITYFIIHILNQYFFRYKSFKGATMFFRNQVSKNIWIGGRVGKYLSMCIIWTFTMNLILVTVANPSILNPGPGSNLSIYYQNVQGLIPFGQLKDSNPILDVTKVLEISTHVNRNKVDIVILNETWLKRSVLDNEILSSAQFKIFRKDKTAWSHPPDPLNPN